MEPSAEVERLKHELRSASDDYKNRLAAEKRVQAARREAERVRQWREDMESACREWPLRETGRLSLERWQDALSRATEALPVAEREVEDALVALSATRGADESLCYKIGLAHKIHALESEPKT